MLDKITVKKKEKAGTELCQAQGKLKLVWLRPLFTSIDGLDFPICLMNSMFVL